MLSETAPQSTVRFASFSSGEDPWGWFAPAENGHQAATTPRTRPAAMRHTGSSLMQICRTSVPLSLAVPPALLDPRTPSTDGALTCSCPTGLVKITRVFFDSPTNITPPLLVKHNFLFYPIFLFLAVRQSPPRRPVTRDIGLTGFRRGSPGSVSRSRSPGVCGPAPRREGGPGLERHVPPRGGELVALERGLQHVTSGRLVARPARHPVAQDDLTGIEHILKK